MCWQWKELRLFFQNQKYSNQHTYPHTPTSLSPQQHTQNIHIQQPYIPFSTLHTPIVILIGIYISIYREIYETFDDKRKNSQRRAHC